MYECRMYIYIIRVYINVLVQYICKNNVKNKKYFDLINGTKLLFYDTYNL